MYYPATLLGSVLGAATELTPHYSYVVEGCQFDCRTLYGDPRGVFMLGLGSHLCDAHFCAFDCCLFLHIPACQPGSYGFYIGVAVL